MAASRAVGTRGRWGPAALLQAGIVALWLSTFLMARVLEHSPHASLWFPPAAVTFSALRSRLPPTMVSTVSAMASNLAALQRSIIERLSRGPAAVSDLARPFDMTLAAMKPFLESEIAKLQVSVPGHAVMFAMELAPGAANPCASNTE